mmetsp:Transcript_14736/g.55545  ORF Transcript_14736/g.55545 Transcript_14736/m.55545 type:complete len:318 (-) Transcript_14736:943-1896(-)
MGACSVRSTRGPAEAADAVGDTADEAVHDAGKDTDMPALPSSVRSRRGRARGAGCAWAGRLLSGSARWAAVLPEASSARPKTPPRTMGGMDTAAAAQEPAASSVDDCLRPPPNPDAAEPSRCALRTGIATAALVARAPADAAIPRALAAAAAASSAGVVPRAGPGAEWPDCSANAVGRYPESTQGDSGGVSAREDVPPSIHASASRWWAASSTTKESMSADMSCSEPLNAGASVAKDSEKARAHDWALLALALPRPAMRITVSSLRPAPAPAPAVGSGPGAGAAVAGGPRECGEALCCTVYSTSHAPDGDVLAATPV